MVKNIPIIDIGENFVCFIKDNAREPFLVDKILAESVCTYEFATMRSERITHVTKVSKLACSILTYLTLTLGLK